MASLPEPWPLVVATGLEARAVRRALPAASVLLAGVALSRLPAGRSVTGAVVTCGLAGGLRDDVPTGAVLVPRQVLRPDGETLDCDPAFVDALTAAARRLGHEPEQAPLATTAELVVGRARAEWAARGCAGADMETGLLSAADRVATIRVVLDTREHELDPAWRRPAG